MTDLQAFLSHPGTQSLCLPTSVVLAVLEDYPMRDGMTRKKTTYLLIKWLKHVALHRTDELIVVSRDHSRT